MGLRMVNTMIEYRCFTGGIFDWIEGGVCKSFESRIHDLLTTTASFVYPTSAPPSARGAHALIVEHPL